ncbi:protein translocase subunit SecF [Methanosphaerula palustris]|uniref:Protein-export membrane protein SecF n=1 Tax=Methanosphaerula palustris (strain ATCC BAA-1556 / DSM 19958 / E1-9c) TaxID=521011 RepID=B8GGW5_METPE|nr:protein translocase subunit SecF [Methanosphaerula palustris]ACL16370.1 SecD/SecF/SecDF export membrane protein [Methanosphaerula palustris E1-9c]
MGFFSYDINKYPPKEMMTIPLVILVIALIILGINMAHTGMPVTPGIDFAGGTAVTLFTADSKDTIQSYFTDYPILEVGEGVGGGKYLTFGPLDDTRFRALSALILEKYPDAKIDQVGESFGKSLQEQAVLALILSFIGMSLVVFLAFRTFVPCLAVVVSAFSDIAIAAALMNLTGVPLTLGTVAALLMLIGYSVDSDILLTNRVLKRQGNLRDKMAGAFTTGIIMTSTAIAAVAAMWIVSYVGQVQTINEISTVILFGLFADVFNTWVLNAGLLRWYMEGKESRGRA